MLSSKSPEDSIPQFSQFSTSIRNGRLQHRRSAGCVALWLTSVSHVVAPPVLDATVDIKNMVVTWSFQVNWAAPSSRSLDDTTWVSMKRCYLYLTWLPRASAGPNSFRETPELLRGLEHVPRAKVLSAKWVKYQLWDNLPFKEEVGVRWRFFRTTQQRKH